MKLNVVNLNEYNPNHCSEDYCELIYLLISVGYEIHKDSLSLSFGQAIS